MSVKKRSAQFSKIRNPTFCRNLTEPKRQTTENSEQEEAIKRDEKTNGGGRGAGNTTGTNKLHRGIHKHVSLMMEKIKKRT